MASSDGDENYYPNVSLENDRTVWVPLSLTLVEYPKGMVL